MYSVLVWNIENFRGEENRIADVVKHIKDQDPDIFGILEVEGIDVPDLMQNRFPNYDFNVTDGPQQMEIIVAHRRGTFDQVTFTQKREFKAFNPRLRPGALLTVRIGSDFHNMLFLHTDSGTEAPDFGNRQEMFEKIESLKRSIDRLSDGGEGRLLVMGDLNTMGLWFPTRRQSDLRVSADDEITALGKLSSKVGMSLLPKDAEKTFNNGRFISDLDHVLASDNLGINDVVAVRGWNQLEGEAQQKFIDEISDHSSLLVKVPDA